MRVVLTGGLGYIGSHTCVELINNGIEVSIIDNPSNSTVDVLEKIKIITGISPTFYKEDIRNQQNLTDIFNIEKPDAVIHFAALKSVSESFGKKDEYYDVNVRGLHNLLNSCLAINVEKFIFSSSAAFMAFLTLCQ